MPIKYRNIKAEAVRNGYTLEQLAEKQIETLAAAVLAAMISESRTEKKNTGAAQPSGE